MKNLVLWVIVGCSICLGATGLLFFMAAGHSGSSASDTARILNTISGGICLIVATVLLIFSGIMFKLNK